MLFGLVAALIFAIDRLTKYLVETDVNLPVDTEFNVIPHVLWIQHLQNACAAFSSMCGPGSRVFLVIAIVVAVALFVYELRQQGPIWVHGALGLVMAGTLGNGYDRLMFGSVTDFIAVHWWPTFNVADTAVSIGVVLLGLGYFWRRSPDA
ncbi:MAG: signal peptidase II [Candidatus Dormibacteraceae bacterium]